MESGLLTYERVRLFGGLEVAGGAGFALHVFDGDNDVAAFLNYSLLLPYVQVRIPAGRSFQFVAGAGLHYFFEFDETDFAGLTVDVSRDGGEWTPGLSFGFNWY